MTWVYRTSKKNDRIDARKQAVLLRRRRGPPVHIPRRQTRRLGHISKEGPAVVRWLLVESVWRAIQKSPGLKAFYERIVGGQSLRKKVAVVAAAKLLTIMRAMLQTGELFNEELVLGKSNGRTNRR